MTLESKPLFSLQTPQDSAVTNDLAVDETVNKIETFESLARYRKNKGYGWDDPDHVALFTRYLQNIIKYFYQV